jgi:hypothetical protein
MQPDDYLQNAKIPSFFPLPGFCHILPESAPKHGDYDHYARLTVYEHRKLAAAAGLRCTLLPNCHLGLPRDISIVNIGHLERTCGTTTGSFPSFIFSSSLPARLAHEFHFQIGFRHRAQPPDCSKTQCLTPQTICTLKPPLYHSATCTAAH